MSLLDEWVDKAEADYKSAVALHRRRKEPLPDVVCYHCQQCVEKYLKAYLIAQGSTPPRPGRSPNRRPSARRGTQGLVRALGRDGSAFGRAPLDLVPGQVDSNGKEDVFVFDRSIGSTALVSHTASSSGRYTRHRMSLGAASQTAPPKRASSVFVVQTWSPPYLF